MDVLEHSLTVTPDELQCLVCAMAGNFPERFGPIRMDLLRKLAKAQRTDARGAVSRVEALEAAIREHLAAIEEAWDGTERSPLWGLGNDLETALGDQ